MAAFSSSSGVSFYSHDIHTNTINKQLLLEELQEIDAKLKEMGELNLHHIDGFHQEIKPLYDRSLQIVRLLVNAGFDANEADATTEYNPQKMQQWVHGIIKQCEATESVLKNLKSEHTRGDLLEKMKVVKRSLAELGAQFKAVQERCQAYENRQMLNVQLHDASKVSVTCTPYKIKQEIARQGKPLKQLAGTSSLQEGSVTNAQINHLQNHKFDPSLQPCLARYGEKMQHGLDVKVGMIESYLNKFASPELSVNDAVTISDILTHPLHFNYDLATLGDAVSKIKHPKSAELAYKLQNYTLILNGLNAQIPVEFLAGELTKILSRNPALAKDPLFLCLLANKLGPDILSKLPIDPMLIQAIKLETSFSKQIERVKTIQALEMNIQSQDGGSPPPKVLIVGAGPAGLSRGLVAWYNGSETQIWEKRSADSEGRPNVIVLGFGDRRLDINFLRFFGAMAYLEEQQQLGSFESFPGFIPDIGLKNVEIRNLESALKQSFGQLADFPIQYDQTLSSSLRIEDGSTIQLFGIESSDEPPGSELRFALEEKPHSFAPNLVIMADGAHTNAGLFGFHKNVLAEPSALAVHSMTNPHSHNTYKIQDKEAYVKHGLELLQEFLEGRAKALDPRTPLKGTLIFPVPSTDVEGAQREYMIMGLETDALHSTVAQMEKVKAKQIKMINGLSSDNEHPGNRAFVEALKEAVQIKDNHAQIMHLLNSFHPEHPLSPELAKLIELKTQWNDLDKQRQSLIHECLAKRSLFDVVRVRGIQDALKADMYSNQNPEMGTVINESLRTLQPLAAEVGLFSLDKSSLVSLEMRSQLEFIYQTKQMAVMPVGDAFFEVDPLAGAGAETAIRTAPLMGFLIQDLRDSSGVFEAPMLEHYSFAMHENMTKALNAGFFFRDAYRPPNQPHNVYRLALESGILDHKEMVVLEYLQTRSKLFPEVPFSEEEKRTAAILLKEIETNKVAMKGKHAGQWAEICDSLRHIMIGQKMLP